MPAQDAIDAVERELNETLKSARATTHARATREYDPEFERKLFAPIIPTFTAHYRMRLATAGEMAAFDAAGRAAASSADGLWWLVVVRQLAPGDRAVVRLYAPLPSWPLNQTSEQLARAVFDTVVGWQS
jgi:hypothetical protein